VEGLRDVEDAVPYGVVGIWDEGFNKKWERLLFWLTVRGVLLYNAILQGYSRLERLCILKGGLRLCFEPISRKNGTVKKCTAFAKEWRTEMAARFWRAAGQRAESCFADKQGV